MGVARARPKMRPVGPGPERIDALRHHRDGMVDHRALKLGERGKALVEVPLGEPGAQTHPAHAESTGAQMEDPNIDFV